MPVTNYYSQHFSVPVYATEADIFTNLLYEVGVRGVISDLKGEPNTGLNVFKLTTIHHIINENLSLTDKQIKDRLKMLEFQYYIKNKGIQFTDSIWVLRIRDVNGGVMSWQKIRQALYDLGLKDQIVTEAKKRINEGVS